MRESKVEKALADGVALLGGTCEKFTTPGKKGPPDRLICWPYLSAGWLAIAKWGEDTKPIVEFAETKAPDGVLKPWQIRDHHRRRTMGFQVHVPWDLTDVETYLRSRGKT